MIQVHDQRWPVHKYILVSRCANFPSLLVSCSTGNNDMTAPVLELSDIHPQILEQVLQYIYTDSCDLLTIGTEFVLLEDPERIHQKYEDIFDMEVGDGDNVNGTINGKKSAYQVIQEQGKGRKGKGEKKRQQGPNERNPLKLLLDVARKWGVRGLVKRCALHYFSSSVTLNCVFLYHFRFIDILNVMVYFSFLSTSVDHFKIGFSHLFAG